eukprot:355733-Chlamydomonas_euryale.AAC.3
MPLPSPPPSPALPPTGLLRPLLLLAGAGLLGAGRGAVPGLLAAPPNSAGLCSSTDGQSAGLLGAGR